MLKTTSFFVAVFLFFFGYYAFFAAKAPIAADTWVHATIGKYILIHKQIPRHSDLSYKRVESHEELLAHSWVFSLFTALLIHSYMSQLLFLVLSIIVSLVIVDAILQPLLSRHEYRFFFLTIATILFGASWYLHPFMFLIPLLLWALYLLASVILHRNTSGLFFLPVCAVLLANFSGGYVVFFGILLVLYFPVLLRVFKKNAWKTVSVLIGISILATGINPHAFKIWDYSRTIWKMILEQQDSISLVGVLQNTNVSYVRDSASSLPYVLYLFYGLFVFCCTVFLFLRRTKEFIASTLIVLPLFPFVFFPILWARLIPVCIGLTLPYAVVLLQILSKKHAFRLRLSVFFVTAVLLGVWLTNFPTTQAENLPSVQLQYIKQKLLPLPVLPSFEITGYVAYSLFPEKGFLDSQDDLFDKSNLVNMFNYAQSLPQEYFKRIQQDYGINTVLASKDTDIVINTLHDSPEWILVYAETSGFLYVQKSTVSKTFLTTHALRYVDPTRNLGFDPQKINEAQSELEAFVRANPTAVLLRGQLATIYRINNKPQKAIEVLDQIPVLNRNLQFYTEKGRALAATGNCKEAERNFKKALEYRSEKKFSRVTLDIAVLYAGCLRDVGKAQHYFERYNSYALPPNEREKVKKIAADFGIILNDLGGSKAQ